MCNNQLKLSVCNLKIVQLVIITLINLYFTAVIFLESCMKASGDVKICNTRSGVCIHERLEHTAICLCRGRCSGNLTGCDMMMRAAVATGFVPVMPLSQPPLFFLPWQVFLLKRWPGKTPLHQQIHLGGAPLFTCCKEWVNKIY